VKAATCVRLSALLIVGAILFPPATARALESDQNQPVYLRADSIVYNEATGKSEYRGGVSLRQGSLHISADVATAIRHGRELETVTAQGRPARARQLVEEEPREIILRGENIRYDAHPRQITLNGQVDVQRGRDRIAADKAIYDLDKGILEAWGRPGHPISATLWRQPETKP
jgi:lipopolysaccharide export system protein LptA